MLNQGIGLDRQGQGQGPSLQGQGLTCKDKDKDKDLNLVLKESLRTRINITGFHAISQNKWIHQTIAIN